MAAQRAVRLRPGDRIAVLDFNHPSCLELTLACAQVGTAYAAVNFRLAPPEMVYVINDARARLLFVGPEFAGAIEQLREQLPTVERVIRVGGPDDEYEAWLAAHEPDARVHPASPEDCFVQLYTSGTTGFPKGAMLTHRGMLAHARNVALDQDMGPDAKVQVSMPLFHVGGTSDALVAISEGARIAMLRLPDPGGGAGDATGLWHDRGMRRGHRARRVGPHESDRAHRLVSAGRPIPGVEIKICEPGTGEPGESGSEASNSWVAIGESRKPPPRRSRRTAGCAPATAVT
jgi:acyl-CoA synthetase (AMP-forming)/AMP-acid ligase II